METVDVQIMLSDDISRTIRVMMDARDPSNQLVSNNANEAYAAVAFRSQNGYTTMIAELKPTVKAGVAMLRTIVNSAAKNNVDCLIVVSVNKITYTSAKLLENHKAQHFLVDELKFPIIEHSLVPQHIGLSDEEADKVLESLGVDRLQLPRLKTTDPICRFQNFPPGTVVKIKRQNGLQQMSWFYRLVVSVD